MEVAKSVDPIVLPVLPLEHVFSALQTIPSLQMEIVDLVKQDSSTSTPHATLAVLDVRIVSQILVVTNVPQDTI